jgi:hypothetical protein
MYQLLILDCKKFWTNLNLKGNEENPK